MPAPRRRSEILLEPPLARHTDVSPAVEDRSYVVFIAGAMVMAVAGGFALAVAASLAGAGVAWADRGPWLVQAHGWAQLMGWAGLFVAGMGFRLLPRFAGRPPLPKVVMLSTFGLLGAGVVSRTVAQPWAGDGPSAQAMLGAQLLWAAGATLFSGTIAVTVARGRSRGRREPWTFFALAGAAWWLGWAVAGLATGAKAADNNGFVTTTIDEPLTWVVMLGAVGNFIWAVQSRSVPVFFGRPTPTLRRVVIPAVLLNAAVALLFASCWVETPRTHARLLGSGFVLGGLALAWLAPVAGSCWGRAIRLRPRARAAARFVLAANLAAVLCGLLLVWAGLRTVQEGGFAAAGARDAARHAFGAGVVTLLIVGMAQLIAPFFAIRRVESGVGLVDHVMFVLLAGAAGLRIAGGLLWETAGVETRSWVGAVAGSLAWVGVVLFAATVVSAVRNEPRRRAAIAATARSPGEAPET